jgi:hypothetical protein
MAAVLTANHMVVIRATLRASVPKVRVQPWHP